MMRPGQERKFLPKAQCFKDGSQFFRIFADTLHEASGADGAQSQ